MIIKGCLFIQEGLVGSEGGVKGKYKICLAGEFNPGLQRERREHYPLLRRIDKTLEKYFITNIM